MIAVAGGKGGSGKTTTTLGVARALASISTVGSVTAIDADWDLPNLAALARETNEGTDSASADGTGGGSADGTGGGSADGTGGGSADGTSGRTDEGTAKAVRTNQNPAFEITAITDVLNDDATSEAARRNDSAEPVRQPRSTAPPQVLSAPQGPTALDAADTFARLAAVRPEEAITLFDCPAGASPDAAAPLRVAENALLVTPLQPAALHDTVKTAEMARALGCPPVGVVLTRTTRTPDRLSDLLDCPILGTIPETAPRPLATDTVCAAYEELARRLVEQILRNDDQDGHTQNTIEHLTQANTGSTTTTDPKPVDQSSIPTRDPEHGQYHCQNGRQH